MFTYCLAYLRSSSEIDSSSPTLESHVPFCFSSAVNTHGGQAEINDIKRKYEQKFKLILASNVGVFLQDFSME